MWHSFASRHHWVVLAERGIFRIAMIVLGLCLMLVGLGLGVTMVMLPPGIVIGLLGVALTIWGAVADLPMDE